MKKTPPQDAWFWLMLLSATVLGETAGDLISMTLLVGYGVGTLVLAALLVIALAVELATRTEHPALFWTLIILTSTTGTTLSDLITRTLKLGYTRGTLALAVLLAVIFAQMVDDPSAHPDLFPTEKAQEKERQRLFRIIEDLVLWENTTILHPARS